MLPAIVLRRPIFIGVTVISVMNAADFDEFMTENVFGIEVVRLFNGRKSYLTAVSRGQSLDSNAFCTRQTTTRNSRCSRLGLPGKR